MVPLHGTIRQGGETAIDTVVVIVVGVGEVVVIAG
jgi:hypothetical protein